MTVEPKLPRHWFRFSLRSLLVVVTVACVLSFGVTTALRYLYPPKPENEWDELMRLIEKEVQPSWTKNDASTELRLGGGQVQFKNSEVNPNE